jgi:putative transposase
MNAPFIRFETADSIILDGTHYAIEHRDDLGITISTLASPKIMVTRTHDELRQAYFSNRMQIVRGGWQKLEPGIRANLEKSIEHFPPEYQEEALRRLNYVQACDKFFGEKRYPRRPEGFKRIGQIVARCRRASRRLLEGSTSILSLENFGGSTIREWYWRWVRSGRQLCALVPLHDLKGSDDGEPIDPEVLQIMANRISTVWLTLERPELTAVYQLIEADIEARNEQRPIRLNVPSLSTVRRWVKTNVSEYEEVFYREGPEAAKQKFRHVRRAHQPQLPLELIEIDHTPLDVLVVLEDSSPSEGDRRRNRRDRITRRAWLTVAICAATRMIVGWSISLERPSWVSVMSCLRMAILEKDPSAYGASAEYPVFGVPQIIVVDNGREFHSKSMMAMAGQLSIEVRFMPRRRPHFKGKVERLNGTINRDFLAFLGGKTFRDTREKGEYDSERWASYTLPELDRAFGRWALDIYHCRPHAGLLGQTPLQHWISLRASGVRVPPKAEQLYAILSLVVQRKITNKGVTFLGLTYQSAALQAIRRRPTHHSGLDYTIKVDPYDLGKILVMDEQKGAWISVPCQQPELADGVSLVEWKQIVELARKTTDANKRVYRRILLKARHDLAEEAQLKKNRKPRRMTQSDINWFSRHYEDPVFQIDASVDGARDHEAERLAKNAERRRRGDPKKVIKRLDQEAANSAANSNEPTNTEEPVHNPVSTPLQPIEDAYDWPVESEN